MSKIGRRPIPLPEGVEVKIESADVTISGPKGQLSLSLLPGVEVCLQEGQILVSSLSSAREASAYWGLTRSLLANAVEGVSQGYERRLTLEGMGYRVSKKGQDLTFALGFSHPVEFAAPTGITLEVEGNNLVIVRGIDKTLVGQTAANIRRLRPPEPYKGKGIRYEGEVIRRKAGKAGKVGSGAPAA